MLEAKAAAIALGNTKSDEAIDPLINAINDTSAEVRKAVITSLANLRAKDAMGQIALFLGDSSEDVRGRCCCCIL
ncbi:MAG: HEAT repeat domain-containing protein [Nitrospinota bacterium]